MAKEIFEKGAIYRLLETEFVNTQTKDVLKQRLGTMERPEKKIFTPAAFATLAAVCDTLFPQQELDAQIALPVLFEKEMVEGKGRGWRYAKLPPMQESFVRGIDMIDAEAHQTFNRSFAALGNEDRETILKNVQAGKVKTIAWQSVPPALFFTELLTTLTEIFYSHPAAKQAIGDVSFADVSGWHALGLDKLEQREPKRLGDNEAV